MKKQKMLLVMALGAVLFVVWVIVLRAYLNIDEKKEQREHIAAGDDYLEKELYVRAIPEYKEALEFDTGEATKLATEEKLLRCYKEYGDFDSYTKLVRDRIDEGTVTEENIITAASYYLENYDEENALKLLETGIACFPESDPIKSMYEDNRFGYSSTNTGYTDILITDDTELIPAYDGTHWVYINSRSRLAMENGFEKATGFYTNADGDQYAGACIEGKWYIITNDGSWYGRDDNGLDEIAFLSADRAIGVKDGKYGYYNMDLELISDDYIFDRITMNACGAAAVESDGIWSIITDDGKYIVEPKLQDVAINSLGAAYAANRAMVKQDGGWSLIDIEGKPLNENKFAGAKAPESDEYIAVADNNGLWGFADGDGNLVIDYQYKDAYSFSEGLAAVSDGFEWFYINKENEVVIDEDYQKAFPFHSGYAVTYIDEFATLVELNYKED